MVLKQKKEDQDEAIRQENVGLVLEMRSVAVVSNALTACA